MRAGELSELAIAVKLASGTTNPEIIDPETLQRAAAADPRVVGQAYLDQACIRTGDATHFVDKMPVNFLYIGFIRRIFPNAKIIGLRRHPLDTCLSNFRQFFDPKFSFYHYSFDLLDTGRYYAGFDQLMRHWQTLYSDNLLLVDYEAMVTDQETESRRLIEFCGLPWEDACLNFESNSAPVATASSVQVRQPVYRDAMQRWKRYERHLDPLKTLLTDAGIPLDS